MASNTNPDAGKTDRSTAQGPSEIHDYDSVLEAVGRTALIRSRGISRGTPHLFVRPSFSIRGAASRILSRFDFLDYLTQRR